MNYILYAVLSVLSVYLEPITTTVLGVSFIVVIWVVSSTNNLKFPLAIFAILSSILVDITLKYPVGSHLLILVIYLISHSLISNLFPDDSFIIKFSKIFVSLVISVMFLKVLANGLFDISFILPVILSSVTTTVIALLLNYLISLFKSGADTSGFRLKV